mmetsp:Transcript_29368/g.49322  ORF Transcript_29368/g.49322 Transcript_29368/m.49322 type:complete len:320 (+) Transcript_29368:1219-2178(+)
MELVKPVATVRLRKSASVICLYLPSLNLAQKKICPCAVSCARVCCRTVLAVSVPSLATLERASNVLPVVSTPCMLNTCTAVLDTAIDTVPTVITALLTEMVLIPDATPFRTEPLTLTTDVPLDANTTPDRHVASTETVVKPVPPKSAVRNTSLSWNNKGGETPQAVVSIAFNSASSTMSVAVCGNHTLNGTEIEVTLPYATAKLVLPLPAVFAELTVTAQLTPLAAALATVAELNAHVGALASTPSEYAAALSTLFTVAVLDTEILVKAAVLNSSALERYAYIPSSVPVAATSTSPVSLLEASCRDSTVTYVSDGVKIV